MIYRPGLHEHTDGSGVEWFLDQLVSREVLDVFSQLIAAEGLTVMDVYSIEINGETPPVIERARLPRRLGER